MLVTYLDTSALLKRYVREAGSEAFQHWWPSIDLVGTVGITRAEMAAALARGKRLGWLGDAGARDAWEAFLEDWETLVVIETSSSLVARAGELAWEYDLRGYDAVHLAGALVLGDILGPPVTLGTFDGQLWEAGKKARLAVWPEDLVRFH